MNESLADGESIHLGDFGSFRMVAGSKGSSTEKDFNTSLFHRAHIVFYPGTMLTDTIRNASFEKYNIPGTESKPEEGGGGSDRPEIE